MSSETLFYVLGICLVVVALVVSAIGLLAKDRFPSPPLMRLTALLFAALVAATATFSVINARDEQEKRRAELAAEPVASGEPAPPPGEAGEGGAAPQPKVKGPGGTLQLAADPTAIAYDKKKLTSKPGEVTIDFDNPSQVSHDVAIEEGGTEIAKSDLIAEGKTSVAAELAPGSYVFFCSVPGHREAGMEGTLTVR
jgi:plastocyanin